MARRRLLPTFFTALRDRPVFFRLVTDLVALPAGHACAILLAAARPVSWPSVPSFSPVKRKRTAGATAGSVYWNGLLQSARYPPEAGLSKHLSGRSNPLACMRLIWKIQSPLERNKHVCFAVLRSCRAHPPAPLAPGIIDKAPACRPPQAGAFYANDARAMSRRDRSRARSAPRADPTTFLTRSRISSIGTPQPTGWMRVTTLARGG